MIVPRRPCWATEQRGCRPAGATDWQRMRREAIAPAALSTAVRGSHSAGVGSAAKQSSARPVPAIRPQPSMASRRDATPADGKGCHVPPSWPFRAGTHRGGCSCHDLSRSGSTPAAPYFHRSRRPHTPRYPYPNLTTTPVRADSVAPKTIARDFRLSRDEHSGSRSSRTAARNSSSTARCPSLSVASIGRASRLPRVHSPSASHRPSWSQTSPALSPSICHSPLQVVWSPSAHQDPL